MAEPLRADPRVHSLIRAMTAAAAGLVVGAGLTFLVAALLGTAISGLPTAILIVITLVLTQGVAFGGVALAYLSIRGLGRRFIPAAIPSIRDLVWVIVGYVLALGGAFLGLAIVVITGAPAAQNQLGEVAVENPELLLFLVPFSFLLIGPGEELLFRGIVQGTLREAFGPVAGVTIASAIFAAVHYLALSGGASARLTTVAVLFLPSLVFGAAYERTRNLVVPALIHGAYNATLFLLVFVALRFAPGG